MDSSGNVIIQPEPAPEPWSEPIAQSSLDSVNPNPWPHPDRPGNHFLSIYMCGFIDISGGGIELREPAEETFVDEHNEA